MEGIRGNLVQHPFPLAGLLLIPRLIDQGIQFVGTHHLQQQPPLLKRPRQGGTDVQQPGGFLVAPDQLVFLVHLEVAHGGRLKHLL